MRYASRATLKGVLNLSEKYSVTNIALRKNFNFIVYCVLNNDATEYKWKKNQDNNFLKQRSSGSLR